MLGGESDCRNRTLHKLFLLIGLGERAGSGLPKIRHGWPGEISLSDSMEPYNQTRLELRWPTSGEPRQKGTTQKTTQKTAQITTQKTVQEEILRLLKAEGALTRRQLAERLALSESGIKYHLAKLKVAGHIRRCGSDRSGNWEVLP